MFMGYRAGADGSMLAGLVVTISQKSIRAVHLCLSRIFCSKDDHQLPILPTWCLEKLVSIYLFISSI